MLVEASGAMAWRGTNVIRRHGRCARCVCCASCGLSEYVRAGSDAVRAAEALIRGGRIIEALVSLWLLL
jgi:hypothetical protein